MQKLIEKTAFLFLTISTAIVAIIAMGIGLLSVIIVPVIAIGLIMIYLPGLVLLKVALNMRRNEILKSSQGTERDINTYEYVEYSDGQFRPQEDYTLKSYLKPYIERLKKLFRK
jgi:hypothetical protein